MRHFKDLGISQTKQIYTGDKIKISRILNKQIVILDYRIEDSKHFTGKCLTMQIEMDSTKYVVFTGSAPLIDTIQQIAKEEFPIITTIVRPAEAYQFS